MLNVTSAGTTLGPDCCGQLSEVRGRAWPEPAAAPGQPVDGSSQGSRPRARIQVSPQTPTGPAPESSPRDSPPDPYPITWKSAAARASAAHGGQGHVALAAPGGARPHVNEPAGRGQGGAGVRRSPASRRGQGNPVNWRPPHASGPADPTPRTGRPSPLCVPSGAAGKPRGRNWLPHHTLRLRLRTKINSGKGRFAIILVF